MNSPQVIAHRGYPRNHPENTLAAITAAVACGVKFIEFDIHLTADQVPVLLHDESLTRMCGIPRYIHEVTSVELSQYRAIKPEANGEPATVEPIPTLRQCGDLLGATPGVWAFVEIKQAAALQFGAELAVSRVLEALPSVLDRCTLISFSTRILQEIRRQSDCSIGLVIDNWETRGDTEDCIKVPEFLFCNLAGLPEIGELSIPGMQVAVYEVGDAATARDLARRGVQFVESFAACTLLAELENTAHDPVAV